jgi:hypothetical protein
MEGRQSPGGIHHNRLKAPYLLICLIALLVMNPDRRVSAAEIGQNFRGAAYDRALFRPTGPNAAGSITFDSQGLRITLTEEHGMRPAVGLALLTGLKGDFEITMEFELLQVNPPTGGNGAGVSIYVTMVSYSKEAATIGRSVGKGGTQSFFSHRASTEADGKRKHYGGAPSRAESTTGRLRLTRTGETLSYRVAEGSSNVFLEIFETEIGLEDIDMVRFAADNGGSPTLVDVRIKEVSIHSEEAGAPELLPPRPSRWPVWAGISLAVLVLGGGYWYWSRQ